MEHRLNLYSCELKHLYRGNFEELGGGSEDWDLLYAGERHCEASSSRLDVDWVLGGNVKGSPLISFVDSFYW